MRHEPHKYLFLNRNLDRVSRGVADSLLKEAAYLTHRTSLEGGENAMSWENPEPHEAIEGENICKKCGVFEVLWERWPDCEGCRGVNSETQLAAAREGQS